MRNQPALVQGGRYRGRSGTAPLESRPTQARGVRPAWFTKRLTADGYATYGAIAATVLSVLLAIRFSEIVPAIAALRPVIAATVLCGGYLLTQSRMDVIERTVKDPIMTALFVYVLMGIIGVPFALFKAQSFESLTSLFYGLLLTGSILLIPPTRKALDRFTTINVGAAQLVSAVWILIGQDKRGNGRLTSSGSYDPNDLGAMMCLFLPLAFGMMVRGPVWRRLLGAASAGTFMLMIVETSSRGALVGFAVIMLTLLLTMRPGKAILTLVVAVPLLVGGWLIAPAQFKDRAASLQTVDEDYNATTETGRVAIWKRSWSHFSSSPIVGVGVGNYSVAEGNYFQSIGKTAAWFTAHNTYIQAFIEFGFFGGCALIFAVSGAARGAFNAARWSIDGRPNPFHRPEYLAAITGYFSAVFFLSHAIVFLLFAALGIGGLVRNVHKALAPQAHRRP